MKHGEHINHGHCRKRFSRLDVEDQGFRRTDSHQQTAEELFH